MYFALVLSATWKLECKMICQIGQSGIRFKACYVLLTTVKFALQSRFQQLEISSH